MKTRWLDEVVMMPLLQLTEVTQYYGKVCALRDVSLAVEPGAIGLVGQNGAGKSTLIQILLGLIQPTLGTAQVLGRDVRASGIHLRGRIGYMPERNAMVPGLNGIEYAALADACREIREELPDTCRQMSCIMCSCIITAIARATGKAVRVKSVDNSQDRVVFHLELRDW